MSKKSKPCPSGRTEIAYGDEYIMADCQGERVLLHWEPLTAADAMTVPEIKEAVGMLITAGFPITASVMQAYMDATKKKKV